MVNVIAPIFTRPDGLFRQAIYYPLVLYAAHSLPIALDAWVACDTYSFPEPPSDRRLRGLGPFPYLDVSVTSSESGDSITLAVINRHRDADVETEIELGEWQPKGVSKTFTVNADEVSAVNGFDEERVQVTEGEATVASRFAYGFPAHSVTVLRLQAR